MMLITRITIRVNVRRDIYNLYCKIISTLCSWLFVWFCIYNADSTRGAYTFLVSTALTIMSSRFVYLLFTYSTRTKWIHDRWNPWFRCRLRRHFGAGQRFDFPNGLQLFVILFTYHSRVDRVATSLFPRIGRSRYP